MGPSEWIALAGVALTLLVGIIGGLLALWFRAGRIIERIDNVRETQDDHEKRLRRVELKVAHP